MGVDTTSKDFNTTGHVRKHGYESEKNMLRSNLKSFLDMLIQNNTWSNNSVNESLYTDSPVGFDGPWRRAVALPHMRHDKPNAHIQYHCGN